MPTRSSCGCTWSSLAAGFRTTVPTHQRLGSFPRLSSIWCWRPLRASALGSSGAPYSLVITAIDETTMQPVSAMSLTLPLQAFDSADGWKACPNHSAFVNTKRFTIDVPESVKGHLFHYAATLISANCQLASFISSSQFLLL